MLGNHNRLNGKSMLAMGSIFLAAPVIGYLFRKIGASDINHSQKKNDF